MLTENHCMQDEEQDMQKTRDMASNAKTGQLYRRPVFIPR
jgi:hypothetical protein